MNRWERLLPPTGYPGAPVLPWPDGEPAPSLPDGTAGISVRIRTRTTDPANWVATRAVGVDDRPMWHGVGRMVVVTEPGEHLVELRGRAATETARLVRPGVGEIAELEYWMPASFGAAEGVLVPAPARRRLGSGISGFVAALAALAVVVLLADAAGLRPGPLLVAALFVLAAAAAVLTVKVKGAADRRYRAEVSSEAGAGAPASVAENGLFLGDGPPPAGLAGGDRGLLVVTAGAERDYVWNGIRVGVRPNADPNAWLPWPTLSIDGVAHPLSWRTWCYRLAPGEHEVRVLARPPRRGGQGEPVAPAGEPVTVRVPVVAGRITRLDLRAKATVEVAAASRDRAAPTELTRFAATVEARVSAPTAP
ncbi:hypothetical protein AB0J86_31260 [Micromonospora sp. NPDC049559]|uniref:hypothetical protein n=1 Tax=Micromonospora sp. NPDC049559 TaxID=3155923 RepID=UPI00342D6790